MPMLLPILSLLSCWGHPTPFDGPERPRPERFQDPGLTETGASPALRLWRMQGRYTFPASTVPAGTTVSDRFPIELEEAPMKERKATNLFRGRSPFPETLEDEARMAAPPGMRLYADGEELRYNNNLGGRSWRINGKRLLVGWPGTEAPKVEVSYPAARLMLEQRAFDPAEDDPFQWSQAEVTLSGRTRFGMVIPAPGEAEWDVTLPADAKFETWLAIAPLPLAMLESDGAEVTLSVIEGGNRTEVASKWVTNRVDDFGHLTASLAPWAGKSVTIELASAPGATIDFDHVFLGAPTIWGAPTGEVRHVVVIGLDTTRPDHFSFYGYERPTTPELDEVARTSAVFDHAWTPAPRTRPSFRSAFTGRRPLDAVGARNIAEIFDDHGFATAGIVANIHLQPRFDFNDGFQDWWYDGQSLAGDQVDRALEWLDAHRDRDTFLFLHVMDPHLLYKPPSSIARQFVTDPDPDLPSVFNRWEVYGWLRTNSIDDRRKQHITDLYDAELRYTSQELGRFFGQLDRMPGKTLVVMHSDHGEELFEHGAFEHNHTVYDEVTRGLLWFRSGNGQVNGARIPAPATLADIGPTLFDFAGFEDAPPTDGRSLKGLLLGTEDPAATADRPIPIGHLRYGKERWAVSWKGFKYTLHTASGQEELYDLSTDPEERRDLSTGTPLGPYRAVLAEAHGMRVGRGWRVPVDLEPESAPLVLTLPRPALAAGIVDPEALIDTPANEEWGEKPNRTIAEVGTLTLSDDHLTITFAPGKKSQRSMLYVLFDEDVDPGPLAATLGGEALATMRVRGQVSWKGGGGSFHVEVGTVVEPPMDEATRMRLLKRDEAQDAGMELAELCQLGYVECDTPAAEAGDHPD
jgi:arylsulfatase A-like enzyme